MVQVYHARHGQEDIIWDSLSCECRALVTVKARQEAGFAAWISQLCSVHFYFFKNGVSPGSSVLEQLLCCFETMVLRKCGFGQRNSLSCSECRVYSLLFQAVSLPHSQVVF